MHNTCGDPGKYVRELADGRVRTYKAFKPARNPGDMAGARYVREYNPNTGMKRGWMETYDHAGNVRIVNPKNGDDIHYMFDPMGIYSGSFIP